MNDTAIVPGERIGFIHINDGLEDVERKLAHLEKQFEELPTHRVLHAYPYRIWFDRHTQRISQILVGPGYGGKFLEQIGVGSTLSEVEAVAGPYREELDAYFLDDCPGICFELEDVEDWEELSAPIQFISIFPPP